MTMDLSIVIPAYNEAARLPATLRTLGEALGGGERRVEIIVVNDGSTDGTGELLRQSPGGGIHWRMLHNPGNRGKGFSVRHGMLAASGARRLFTDADLSAPITELPKLEAALDAGAGIAIGSRSRRELLGRRQSRFRENAGRMFNRIVRLSLGLPFTDTQCGFKLFTRESAEAIFPLQRIEGWGFDPELLFLARRFGLPVAEVPVVWAHADGAKIQMARDSLRMFSDVVAIRGRAWRGVYPRAGSERARAAAGSPIA